MKRFIFGLLAVVLLVTSCPQSLVKAEEVTDTTVATDFDFESWHTEAMQAFNDYSTLLAAVAEDSTWDTAFGRAKVFRTTLEDDYLEDVNNATKEQWEAFSQEEVILYHTTYLVFAGMMSRSDDYYNDKFHGRDAAKEHFFTLEIGTNSWDGNNCEAVIAAYKKLVDYQIEYYDYYRMPYNFIDDMSYAEELGTIGVTDETGAEIETETETEIADQQTAKTAGAGNDTKKDTLKKSADNWGPFFSVLKVTLPTLIILAVLLTAYLIVRHRNKKFNIDEMSEDGK